MFRAIAIIGSVEAATAASPPSTSDLRSAASAILVPEMSAAENVMLGREPTSRGLIRWDRVRAAAAEALALVGSDVDPEAPVRTLGVGRQQMVEIAKAVAKRSEILVLDEPTSALPESDARRLIELVRGLRARGISSIYVSHRLEEVFAIADRITVLRDGRSVATAPARDWTPDRVIAAMVGRELTRLYPKDPEVLYHSGRLFANYAYLTTMKLARLAPAALFEASAC